MNDKESKPSSAARDPRAPATAHEGSSAEDWREHEHLSDRGRVQAQRLVEEVGGQELAKLAIDATRDQPPLPPGAAEPGKALQSALARLETALLTPLVSGELTTWVENARHALGELEADLWRQWDEVHPDHFRSIAAQDSEMLPRIEKLRDEDEQVKQAFLRIKQRFDELDVRSQRVEPDEARVGKHLSELTDDALAMILAARKQETAVRTWFVEAFQRDRGEVD
jgi:hypothetical protein